MKTSNKIQTRKYTILTAKTLSIYGLYADFGPEHTTKYRWGKTIQITALKQI